MTKIVSTTPKEQHLDLNSNESRKSSIPRAPKLWVFYVNMQFLYFIWIKANKNFIFDGQMSLVSLQLIHGSLQISLHTVVRDLYKIQDVASNYW